MSEDNATPERDLNQQLFELPEDFFFWLCFWLADLLTPVLTGLIVSSFSAVVPAFLDLDFLFAFPDFLLASPPFGFEPWFWLGLLSPSAPTAPAICRLFSWRSLAARRSLSRYSNLNLAQTLTCKMCTNCELKGHSTQLDTRRRLPLATRHGTRVATCHTWLTEFLAACWQSFSVEQRPTTFSQAGVKGFPFKSK